MNNLSYNSNPFSYKGKISRLMFFLLFLFYTFSHFALLYFICPGLIDIAETSNLSGEPLAEVILSPLSPIPHFQVVAFIIITIVMGYLYFNMYKKGCLIYLVPL